MSVTRYRYDPDLDAVVQIYSHNGPETPVSHQFMPDIRAFRTQEGVEISSRSKLRDYERRTGTKQVGNDWTGPVKPAWHDEFISREKERERYGR